MTDTPAAATDEVARTELLALTLRAIAEKVAAADKSEFDRVVAEARGRFNRDRAARGLERYDGELF
jgi:hypothetical protein